MVVLGVLPAVLVISGSRPTWPDITAAFGTGTALALWVAFVGSILSERVVARDETLILRNGLVDVLVPSASISQVWAEAGSVLVETSDGKVRRPGAFAMRSGILSRVGPYVRAAGAINRWIESVPSAPDGEGPGVVQVRYRLRRYWYTSVVVIAAASYAWTYTLWFVF